MFQYVPWLLKYGFWFGVLLLVISFIVYLYVYAYTIRILKRIDLKRYFILIANSYIFASGLFLILITSGGL